MLYPESPPLLGAQYNRRALRFVKTLISPGSAGDRGHEGIVTTVTRQPRADAVRNREKLQHAAVEEFAEHGQDCPLEAIASRAGVGIGTLYRHFPNRDALVVAAYQNEVDALCAAASELLATHPPDEALRVWAERFTDYLATKRAMGEALRSAMASNAPLFAETRQRLHAALRLLLDAGARAGVLRGDAQPEDVMRVVSAIWDLPDGPTWREDVSRMLGLVFDGLRYGAAAPTSGA
jgi:AcrR family transcriptional regulator